MSLQSEIQQQYHNLHSKTEASKLQQQTQQQQLERERQELTSQRDTLAQSALGLRNQESSLKVTEDAVRRRAQQQDQEQQKLEAQRLEITKSWKQAQDEGVKATQSLRDEVSLFQSKKVRSSRTNPIIFL